MEWCPGPCGSVVFACDDSDDTEAAAAWTMRNLIRPGDTVHFVHVVSDDRASLTGLGDSKSCSYFDSIEEDLHLQDVEPGHELNLQSKGEKLIEKRFVRHAKEANIPSQVHVPVLKGPESAADIGGVLCRLSKQLGARMLVVVSPQRSTFSDFGSIGHHCYEHAEIPLALIPPANPEALDMMTGEIMLVAQDDNEMTGCRNWVMRNLESAEAHLKMVHVWDPAKSSGAVFPACRFSEYEMAPLSCNEEGTAKQQATDYLRRRSEELHPKLTVMYSQAHQGIVEALLDPSFTLKYCCCTRYPVLLLPHSKQSGTHLKENAEILSRWTDHSYDCEVGA
eukprot:evm.model.scf_993.6 EVM.evm.TU.scf_993.6   scf_993:34591-41845(-)